VLLQEGTRGSYVLALTKGRVMVTRVAVSGEEMIMALGDPGEILGDMTVMDQALRSATVTALTDCTVRVLSCEQFRSLICRHGAVDAVARHAFARFREAELARFEMGTLPADQRIACALVRLMAGNPDVGIDLSQDQLARMIGTSRNTVVAVLASLRAQGVIMTSRRRLTVRAPEALHELAAGNTAPTGRTQAM
jgi:CRP/FNR family transcriptional regulator, cyclic AMP receptor protein